MGMLYNVYYFGAAFDRDVRLPEASNDIACVENTNGDRSWMIPVDGSWKTVDRRTALLRAGQIQLVDYSVRIPGYAAYSNAPSLHEARKDRKDAKVRTGRDHAIVANYSDGTTEIVERA